MSFRERISSWREGGSEARRKRREKRTQRAREDAAADEQRALARSGDAQRAGRSPKPAPRAATNGEAKPKPTKGKPRSGASKPGERRKAGARPARRRAGSGAATVGVELAKLAREMVAIPLGLWLAAAEIVAKPVLEVWLRVLLPALRALGRAAAATLRFGERHVTPGRAVAACVAVAIGALAASQWLDYRSISIGADAYAGAVGDVAPPPQVNTEIAGHAHGWVMLPLAALSLVPLVLALTGRRRFALALVPIGIAVIVISVAVDAPKGLDEGETALAYEGAKASLLEGFWVQIVAGGVLVACGLLLPTYLRPQPAGRAAAPVGPSPLQTFAKRVRAAADRRGARRRRPAKRRPGKGNVQGAGT